MYPLWWPKHIVLAHVSKVAKSMRVVCKNIARVHKFLILWRFKIWGDLIHFTHNHNRLMGTITFEVHYITPTSSRNTLTTIFKSILIFLLFMFFAYFSFWTFHAWAYIERKEIPNYVSQKHHNFAMSEHTNVIHDWWALVVGWLFMPFS